MISRENILKIEIRQKIYDFILRNPGSYLREISKKMDIPKSTLRYHLRYLEKQNLVAKSFENKYSRYFVTDKFGKKEKEILTLLKQEVPRNIILHMMSSFVFSQIELSRALKKHPAAIAFYLKKLKDLGLIKYASASKGKIMNNNGKFFDRDKKNSEKIYIIKDASLYPILYDLLIVCKDSCPDKKALDEILFSYGWKKYYGRKSKDRNYKKKLSALEKFMDELMEIFYNRRITDCNGRQIEPNAEDFIDELIEKVYEACPHPYHV